MLGLIIPWWGRALAVLAILAAAAAFGAAKMHAFDEKRYDELQDQFDRFKDQVRASGLEAKAAAKAQAVTDKKRKESANAENADALATLARTIGELRRAHPAGGRVPAAPAGASRPDLACFDRPESERAYGALVVGLRGLADEGAKSAVDLNSAKRWAQQREQ